MSKRHQSNRRKSYGRRQHDLGERRHRDPGPRELELVFDDLAPACAVDRLPFLDPRMPRLQYALGD